MKEGIYRRIYDIQKLVSQALNMQGEDLITQKKMFDLE